MQANSYSVIIPAYNAARTIIAAVESCLQQTLPPKEVIVVNDGSSDDTEALLRKRFGAAIQIITLTENRGPAAARNTGIRLAKGNFIAFQDADDLWHPEKLERLDAVLRSKPGIRFLFHPYTLAALDFELRPEMFEARPYPLWKLLLSNPIGTPCVVMQNHPGLQFSGQLRHMEDYELFLREAAEHGAYQVAAPLTRIGRPILSAGGQSSARWKMRVGEMRAWLLFARSKPFYYFAVVPLILFALAKHFVKSFFPPRSNY